MIDQIRTASSSSPADPDRPCHGAELADFREGMRRFVPTWSELPVAFRATCAVCGELTDATFRRVGGQVVLASRCQACGPRHEVHHDAIWTEAVSDFPGSAKQTYTGARVHPVLRRVPRTVETLCPECGAILLGRYFVHDGAVYIEKSCPDHGYFRDCVNSDALLQGKAAWWTFEEHPGQRHPQRQGAGHCPSDCGLCGQHLSSPCLAQIDLTNRCNMRCPICFANAGVTGVVSEPDYDQIVRQLQVLRDLRPHPCTAIQFTGGEPTIHPDFLRIVSAARDMGFTHIQIATNGLKIADPAFARQCHDAGLHTLYMQFDGIGEAPYRQTRNYPGIWEKKLAAIESCRQVGLKICLVPTIIKGVNDEQVGEILRFALKNVDVISAVSYQPVSFTGRHSLEELAERRYTLGDLARDIGAASGASPLRDMFPLSVTVPLSQVLEALTGKPKIRASSHPDCAFGTYFLVAPDGTPHAFPKVVDIEGLFWDMNRLAARIRRRGQANWLDKLRLIWSFKRHFRADQAPEGLTVKRFIRSIYGMLDKSVGRGEGEKLTYKTMLCAGMHFQDRYNYDVERTKRCVILYSTPEGVFPFCSHNCGPQYRYVTEREFARRLGEDVPAGPGGHADKAGDAPAAKRSESAVTP